MKPQQVLVHLYQTGKYPAENADNFNKGIKIRHAPGSVIFREKGAVPKPVVKDSFIGMSHPEPKVRQPQTFDCSHRIRKHGEGIELQIIKNRCRLPVDMRKALHQQLFLAVKVTVQRPG